MGITRYQRNPKSIPDSLPIFSANFPSDRTQNCHFLISVCSRKHVSDWSGSMPGRLLLVHKYVPNMSSSSLTFGLEGAPRLLPKPVALNKQTFVRPWPKSGHLPSNSREGKTPYGGQKRREKAFVPAPLGLTSGLRGHVATEHDVRAWEAWLTLKWLSGTPGGTLAHRLKCQRGLTPKCLSLIHI